MEALEVLSSALIKNAFVLNLKLSYSSGTTARKDLAKEKLIRY